MGQYQFSFISIGILLAFVLNESAGKASVKLQKALRRPVRSSGIRGTTLYRHVGCGKAGCTEHRVDEYPRSMPVSVIGTKSCDGPRPVRSKLVVTARSTTQGLFSVWVPPGNYWVSLGVTMSHDERCVLVRPNRYTEVTLTATHRAQ